MFEENEGTISTMDPVDSSDTGATTETEDTTGAPSAETKNTDTPGGGEGEGGEGAGEGGSDNDNPDGEGGEGEGGDDTPPKDLESALAVIKDLQSKVDNSDDTRFDKHPRFKQLNERDKQKTQQIADLTNQVEALTKTISESKSTRDFEGEIAELDKQLDEGDISSSEYKAKVKEINQAEKDAALEAQNLEREQTEKTQKLQKELLASFDFIESILDDRADEVAAIKTTNPLHDDLSAALAIRISDIEAATKQQVKEAVDKAVKETEERVTKEIEAKHGARSLGSQTRQPANPDDTLKDTSKSGGVVSALSSRLRDMRKAS